MCAALLCVSGCFWGCTSQSGAGSSISQGMSPEDIAVAFAGEIFTKHSREGAAKYAEPEAAVSVNSVIDLLNESGKGSPSVKLKDIKQTENGWQAEVSVSGASFNGQIVNDSTMVMFISSANGRRVSSVSYSAVLKDGVKINI